MKGVEQDDCYDVDFAREGGHRNGLKGNPCPSVINTGGGIVSREAEMSSRRLSGVGTSGVCSM